MSEFWFTATFLLVVNYFFAILAAMAIDTTFKEMTKQTRARVFLVLLFFGCASLPFLLGAHLFPIAFPPKTKIPRAVVKKERS